MTFKKIWIPNFFVKVLSKILLGHLNLPNHSLALFINLFKCLNRREEVERPHGLKLKTLIKSLLEKIFFAEFCRFFWLSGVKFLKKKFKFFANRPWHKIHCKGCGKLLNVFRGKLLNVLFREILFVIFGYIF